ncbi:hypothetical protein CON82_29485 [Bacillus wiedmannii]|nr:hypothetical protein CON82_29485 [Bacillus wiedmannii]
MKVNIKNTRNKALWHSFTLQIRNKIYKILYILFLIFDNFRLCNRTFPITKEYNGKKFGIKDYYYTVESINMFEELFPEVKTYTLYEMNGKKYLQNNQTDEINTVKNLDQDI